MLVEYLKYGISDYYLTIVYGIGLFFYIRFLIRFYKNKKREKSKLVNFIYIVLFIPIFFAFCYLMYNDINNLKAVSKGYKEFTGVYVGIKDLNADSSNRRSYELEYKFKDNEGNILLVKNRYVIFNRFKDLEPLQTYNVTYFKDDLIREIELLEK